MKSIFLICSVLLIFFGISLAHATIGTDEFEKANRAYIDGKYGDAINNYIKVIQQNGFSSNVLFNLGNAYERNGQHGLAILSYERAQRLNPRDPDIAANLKTARAQAGVTVPAERWWQSMLTYFKPAEWAWMAGLL